MAPETKAYEWIYKIIESCTDDFHFDGVDKLIELFSIKYGADNEKMTDQLIYYRNVHWNKTHAIVK